LICTNKKNVEAKATRPSNLTKFIRKQFLFENIKYFKR
jgi:hypothetical protein